MARVRCFSALPDHEVLGLPALSPVCSILYPLRSIHLIHRGCFQTMELGNIVEWFKKEGDFVGAGDAICSIETDKATLDFVATDDGYVGHDSVPGGSRGQKDYQTALS